MPVTQLERGEVLVALSPETLQQTLLKENQVPSKAKGKTVSP